MRAALFDLDGTLVDSEPATDRAIAEVMLRHGVRGAELPPSETRGRTWADIVAALERRYGRRVEARELEDRWMGLTAHVLPIPGAAEAVREARGAGLATAVVSSSRLTVIDAFLARLGIGDAIQVRVGADSVKRPKPDPECWLLAASQLGVAPAECAVFEDSRAGLTGARAAGMRTVLILHRAAEPELARALADAAYPDFLSLPEGWWADLRGRTP